MGVPANKNNDIGAMKYVFTDAPYHLYALDHHVGVPILGTPLKGRS